MINICSKIITRRGERSRINNSASSIYLGVKNEPTANMFRNIAAHEFGHALGVLDAYIHFLDKIRAHDDIIPEYVHINGVEYNDIMWGNDSIGVSLVTDLNGNMLLLKIDIKVI